MPLIPGSEASIVFRTLTIGFAGGAAAWWFGLPAAALLGPALAVSVASLSGLKTALPDPLRDASMVVLGLGIGTGFDAEAGAAILRWPLAIAALAATLAATMIASGTILRRWFGFDRRSALLAAAPGHLSMVLGLAAESGGDVARVAVVQTIRLLALTVAVPFAALALGYRMDPAVLPSGIVMALLPMILLAIAGVALGLALRRAGLPAPLLLGPMLAAAAGQISGLAPGALPAWLMIPGFAILGTLIGTRFSGMSRALFRASLLAGLATTTVATVIAAAAAVPVAAGLGMPVAHVLIAFSPGGLETMIALGATIGASPGFVAACHFARLMILNLMITWAWRQTGARG